MYKGKLTQRVMQNATLEIRAVKDRVYRRVMGYALNPLKKKKKKNLDVEFSFQGCRKTKSL